MFVPFPEPLVEAVFLGRRQRFLSDMELSDGARVVAHCPNTGSMKGCLFPGNRAVLWDSQNPDRKLRYTWKAIHGGVWIGVDTALPNRLVEEAIRAGRIPALAALGEIRRERRMGEHSRVDLLLRGPSGQCYVEVKNVTLVERGAARFPDAVTVRGLRHLTELAARVAEGHRAAMVYVVQREDGVRFEPADDIDPAYARGLRAAAGAGVEVYALGTRVSPSGVEASELLPVGGV